MPRTGTTARAPRVTRVRAVSVSLDLVEVRMPKGQGPTAWTDAAEALAHSVGAQRVSVSSPRPGRLALVVQRSSPFGADPVRAFEIPERCEDVDLSRVRLGVTEFDGVWSLDLARQHLLVVGATGSGKGSVLWSLLRGVGPLIREHRVRVWMIDLKGGLETELGAALFYRRATTFTDAVQLVTDFRDQMRAGQESLRGSGRRRIGAEDVRDLLVIDEMAMLTALGGSSSEIRKVTGVMAEILTQGRATGDMLAGFVQEPTKDVVSVRDLFTVRVCLAVMSDLHVDMALGDGARDRGALADHIPLDDAHAGTGYVLNPLSRTPVQVRAAYVCDRDILDLTGTCTPTPTPAPVSPDTETTPAQGTAPDLVPGAVPVVLPVPREELAAAALVGQDDFDPARFEDLDPDPGDGEGIDLDALLATLLPTTPVTDTPAAGG